MKIYIFSGLVQIQINPISKMTSRLSFKCKCSEDIINMVVPSKILNVIIHLREREICLKPPRYCASNIAI